MEKLGSWDKDEKYIWFLGGKVLFGIRVFKIVLVDVIWWLVEIFFFKGI